jgi:ATP-dependent DNA helicase RecQ
MSPNEVLKKYWGFDEFREGQLQIIQSVLDGKDTLALLPTGGGKSICYQVPALVKQGLCIVISPLIALMTDQVENLQKRGIKAVSLSGNLDSYSLERHLDNCEFGDTQFLFISPERLQNEWIQARLERLKVSLIAIDEAHCISQWGYDFRPSYLKIALLRNLLPEVPFLALTATAGPKVIEDIQSKLAFKEPHCIRKSFHRPNLSYQVLYTTAPENQLLELLSRYKGCSIVYTSSRRSTERLAQWLNQNKISSAAYHAGLPNAIRTKHQSEWIQNKVRVICATTAFGMGIDKPDVRLVVHWEAPESIEAYFQEAGRAGRDGKQAHCFWLETPSRTLIKTNENLATFPSIDEIKALYDGLMRVLKIPMNEGAEQQCCLDWQKLVDEMKYGPRKILEGLKLLQQSGWIEFEADAKTRSVFQFSQAPNTIREYVERAPKFEEIAYVLARMYSGIYEFKVSISEREIAKNSSLNPMEIKSLLRQMAQLNLAEYEESDSGMQISLLQNRLQAKHLRIDKDFYAFKRDGLKERTMALQEFVKADGICRAVKMLRSLGEKLPENCGKCDICLSKEQAPTYAVLKAELEKAIPKAVNIHSLLNIYPMQWKESIVELLRDWVDEGQIKLDDNGNFVL